MAAAIWPAVAGVTFARPKSRILAWPRLVTKMFAGLMSRWTMPSAWAASSASAISMPRRQERFDFQRPARDAVLQRLAVEKLHGDEGLAVLLADFIDGADVGMIQGGSGLRFALKSLQRLRVLGDISGRNFRATKRPQPRVLGLVDHAHAAAAEFFDDAVVRDGLADHSGEPLLRVASSYGAGIRSSTNASLRRESRSTSASRTRSLSAARTASWYAPARSALCQRPGRFEVLPAADRRAHSVRAIFCSDALWTGAERRLLPAAIGKNYPW